LNYSHCDENYIKIGQISIFLGHKLVFKFKIRLLRSIIDDFGSGSWKVETSVSDPDPSESVLKWLPWIQIRIGITDPDPDPGQSKWCTKKKIKLRFYGKKSIDHFAEGLMVFT